MKVVYLIQYLFAAGIATYDYYKNNKFFIAWSFLAALYLMFYLIEYITDFIKKENDKKTNQAETNKG